MDGRELHVRVRRGVKAPLGRISGRVRIIARRSMKAVPKRTARKHPSAPGTPPHTIFNRAKGGHRMRMVLYAERQPGEWVVGPTILGMRSRPTPALHEHGWSRALVVKHVIKTGRKTTARQRAAYRKKHMWTYKSKALRGRVKTSIKMKKYPRRPFMEPALVKMVPLMPQMFKNSIKK